jgi:hypothetical protein
MSWTWGGNTSTAFAPLVALDIGTERKVVADRRRDQADASIGARDHRHGLQIIGMGSRAA